MAFNFLHIVGEIIAVIWEQGYDRCLEESLVVIES